MSIWVIEFRKRQKGSRWRIWRSTNFLASEKDARWVADGLSVDKYYIWRVREYQAVKK